MASPTIIDMMSRTGSMAETSKKKWVKKATANAHGQFRRKAEAAGESTRAFAQEHEHSPGRLGRQAGLADNLMGLPHAKKKSDIYAKSRSKMESR